MHARPSLAAAALLTTLALVTSACSSGTSTKPGAVAIKVLMIGYPDNDSIDPGTGTSLPGIGQLESKFEKAHPEIDLDIINIPWGEGATGYAPKTQAMINANEACLYEMPAAPSYARKGDLVNLDTLIESDSTFQNVWGDQLETSRTMGPDKKMGLYYLPDNTGERVINWDAKLFEDYGVEPLSTNPTLQELEEKAAKLTGIDPVTNQQTYGYWYQGKYAVWQFMAIAHAFGANWGSVQPDGSLAIDWDTPQYLTALNWFITMSKYAPKGALAGDGMPQGFLSDQNTVAIIPEGEQGYFVSQEVAHPELAQRFRTSYNLTGSDGHGGLNTVSPLAMAASCPNKDAAWTALKWIAGSNESQQYFFEAAGRIPVTTDGAKALPQVASLPDGQVILDSPQHAEAVYPWAADQPRWSLQTALENALAGTATPEQALQQAQAETEDWLATQGASG